MLSFKEYINTRCAKPVTKKPLRSKSTINENINLDPTELINDLIAMNAKSIRAEIVTDTDAELTLFLQLKK